MESSSIVYVDTSVFINFFKASDKELEFLLLSNRVALSRYVRLELILGVKRRELRFPKTTLEGLIFNKPSPDFLDEVEAEISQLQQTGLNVGLVDAIIILEAKRSGFALYTHDKMMKKLASKWGVAIYAD